MQVLGHLFYDMVALRMYRRVVERVLGVSDAQEAGALLEGGRSQSGYLLQLSATSKGSVLLPVVHDVLSQYGTQSTDVGQQVF